MGLFRSIFGSSSTKYSQKEYSVSSVEIKKLVSRAKTRSLSAKEEAAIEEAIIKRRRGDGKISLRQIYEALNKLKNLNMISKYDRDGVMTVFRIFFVTKKIPD